MAQTIVPVWTLSDRLVKARHWAGMTQEEMADDLGMHRKTLIRHERSENPPKSFILAYSAVTGVPVAWLLGIDDDEPDVRSRCFSSAGITQLELFANASQLAACAA